MITVSKKEVLETWIFELPKGEKLHKQVVYQSLGRTPPPPAHTPNAQKK